MRVDIQTKLTVREDAAPLLTAMLEKLADGDKGELNKAVADEAEVLTANHLLGVRTEHKTAKRLGAEPTYFFQRMSQAVESWSDGNGAHVTIPTGEAAISNLAKSAGAAAVGSRGPFAAWWGPVNIVAINSSYLTIPASKIAYGRRAEEVPNLRFIPFASGAKALAQVEGKGADRKINVHYWLKEEVDLPEDKTLLPTDAEYLAAAERGAENFTLQVMEEQK